MILSIIVPVFNEEKSIGTLINKLLNLNFSSIGFEKEIIIVNDGSTDETSKILEKFNQIKVINQKNSGKGSAVQNGIKNSSGEFILIQDGDLEYDPKDIINMCKLLLNNKNLTVYGSRYKPFKFYIFPKFYKGQNISSYLANIIFIFLFLIFYRKFISDPLTGYKLYKKNFFLLNKIKSNGFEADHEISAKLIKNKFQIIEVPISYYPRTKNEGKKINFFDAIKAIITIIKYRFKN